MKYDLSQPFDLMQCKNRLEKLIAKGAKIELTQYIPKRTNLQNRYFHCACGILSGETGYTLEEIKELIKQESGFMTYEKGGRKFYRSTSDLNKDEFGNLIDFILKFATDHGFEIMTPEQFYEHQFGYEKLVQKNEKVY